MFGYPGALSGRAGRRLRHTSAEVKAESDICCTSSNAVQVVESPGAERVIMLPDEYLAVRRLADQSEDHRLEGPLRGA